MSQTFGQRLQDLRQAANVSQPQLATAAGIPLGTLRNLEQGRRVPRLDTAQALARALGITLDALAGDTLLSGDIGQATDEPAPPRGRPKKATGDQASEEKPKKKGKGRGKA